MCERNFTIPMCWVEDFLFRVKESVLILLDQDKMWVLFNYRYKVTH